MPTTMNAIVQEMEVLSKDEAIIGNTMLPAPITASPAILVKEANKLLEFESLVETGINVELYVLYKG